MPAEAINHVYTLSRRAPEGLTFGDRENNEVHTYEVDDDDDIDDEEDDSDYEPP
jgi:hypothetical protein